MFSSQNPRSHAAPTPPAARRGCGRVFGLRLGSQGRRRGPAAGESAARAAYLTRRDCDCDCRLPVAVRRCRHIEVTWRRTPIGNGGSVPHLCCCGMSDNVGTREIVGLLPSGDEKMRFDRYWSTRILFILPFGMADKYQAPPIIEGQSKT
jgi:hypothetical protein